MTEARFLIELACISASALAVFYVAGFAPSLFLPRRFRRHALLFAPILGFAVISGVSHYLGAAGFAAQDFVWPSLIVLGLSGAVIWWRRGRTRPGRTRPGRTRLAWRENGVPLALIAGFYLIAVSPLVLLGYVTTVGATIDAISHVCRAEVVQKGSLAPPEIPENRPFYAWAASPMRVHFRMGDAYFLAAVDVVSGYRAYQTFTPVSAMFFAFMAGGIYVLCRVTLRLGRRAALIAMTLVGLSNLLLWAVFDDFLSQSVGASLVPPTLSVVLESLRRRRWREGIPAGLLLSALASAYTVYVLYALAVAGLFALWCWWRVRGRGWRELQPLVGTGLVIALAAALSNGVAVLRSAAEALLLVSESQQKRGNITVFPHPAEIAGLTSHAVAAFAPGHWLQMPAPLLTALFLAVAGAVVFGLVRLPRPVRPGAALILAVALAMSLDQRLGLLLEGGFPYGYFKVLSLVTLAVLPLLGQAFSRGLASRLRPLAGAALLALVAVNTLNIALTVRYTSKHGIVLDRGLIEVREGVERLSSDAALLLDLPAGLRQNWLGYLLKDRDINYKTPLALWPVVELRRPLRSFEYSLVSRDLDRGAPSRDALIEPWRDPDAYTELWANQAFSLRQRHDDASGELRLQDEPLRLGPGQALAVVLGEGRIRVRGERGADLAAPLAGPSRSLQILFANAGSGARVELGAAGVFELESGLHALAVNVEDGAEPLRFANAGETMLGVFTIKVSARRLSSDTPSLTRLSIPLAYCHLSVAGGEVVELSTQLIAPAAGAALPPFRIGLHIAGGKDLTYGNYGAWGIDFKPSGELQAARLAVDLAARTARGELDGEQAEPVGEALAVTEGSFQGQAVLWDLSRPALPIGLHQAVTFEREGSHVRILKTAPSFFLFAW